MTLENDGGPIVEMGMFGNRRLTSLSTIVRASGVNMRSPIVPNSWAGWPSRSSTMISDVRVAALRARGSNGCWPRSARLGWAPCSRSKLRGLPVTAPTDHGVDELTDMLSEARLTTKT